MQLSIISSSQNADSSASSTTIDFGYELRFRTAAAGGAIVGAHGRATSYELPSQRSARSSSRQHIHKIHDTQTELLRPGFQFVCIHRILIADFVPEALGRRFPEKQVILSSCSFVFFVEKSIFATNPQSKIYNHQSLFNGHDPFTDTKSNQGHETAEGFWSRSYENLDTSGGSGSDRWGAQRRSVPGFEL